MEIDILEEVREVFERQRKIWFRRLLKWMRLYRTTKKCMRWRVITS